MQIRRRFTRIDRGVNMSGFMDFEVFNKIFTDRETEVRSNKELSAEVARIRDGIEKERAARMNLPVISTEKM